MTCLNCKSTLSCGCQKKVASNEASVCAACLPNYEAGLKGLKTSPLNPNIRTFKAPNSK